MGILRYSSACVWCPVAHPTSAKVGLGICSEFWGSERGGVCTCQLQIVYVYLGGGDSRCPPYLQNYLATPLGGCVVLEDSSSVIHMCPP